jgi:hypothetical protein
MKFYLKTDAIKSINKSTCQHIRLIQKDIDEKGRKYFYTMNVNDLYNKIKLNKDTDKPSHYYESWTDRNKLVFSLDIDSDLLFNNKPFDDVIKKNIVSVIKYGKQFYNYDYDIRNIIIIKTKKQTKKDSAHIIFRGIAFENNMVCKNFYKRMIKEDNECLPFSDQSIYNMTCLRTCFSTKKGKDYPLKPYSLEIKGKNTQTIKDYYSELDYFCQTLITTIDELEEENKTIKISDIIETEEEEDECINSDFVQINDHTDDQIIELLSHLPQDYCDDYRKWNKVGMTLYSINENYLNLYDEWSKKSSKYKSGCANTQWDYYRRGNFDKSLLSIGSLMFWAKEGGYTFPNKSLEHIVSTYPSKPIIVSKKDNFNYKTISQNKLTPTIFNQHLDKKLLAIQSEKGTGKTYNLLRSLFDDNKNTQPESILFISSRRTFGIKLSADLKKYGFRLYSEIDEHYIYDKRVICQIDSLLRLQKNKFDLIIIDECESLARYLTSNHFTKSNKANTIVSNLEFRISDANNVIIMDADLSDRCINNYTSIISNCKELKKNDIQVIINNYTPYQDYTIKYMKYNIWLNQLLLFIMNNKKIVVPMASNSKAKDLYTKLKNDFPEKNILLIHKETSDDEKLKKLLKVNEIWVNYDVVIYTPTVCMGVSFESVHFDNIFAYGCHNSLGSQEFCQMMHRVRNPKNKDIYVSFDHYKYYDPIDDKITYNQVEEMLCNDYYLTYHDINSNLVQKKFKRVGNERVMFYPYKDEPIYDVYIRNSLELIENKLNFTSNFFGYIKYKNYQYEFFDHDDNDNIMKELKEIRKKREEEEKEKLINDLLKAKTLTKEEYKEKIMRKEKYLDENSIYEIKKYNLIKNYGIKDTDLTEEIIDEFYDKRKMLNYNNFSNILSTETVDFNKKLKIMKSNENINNDYITCYQDFTFKNKYTYHYYAIILLDYCGFSIDHFDDIYYAIPKHELEINMYKHIDGRDIITFLKEERYGIYQKFDIKMLLNKEIEYDLIYSLKIVNKVIQSQYGLKIKKKGKKDPSYYLTTNKKWDNLPSTKVKPKDIIDYKDKGIKSKLILDNLDNNLFEESSDDSEDDNNLNYESGKSADSDNDNEFDYINDKMLKQPV